MHYHIISAILILYLSSSNAGPAIKLRVAYGKTAKLGDFKSMVYVLEETKNGNDQQAWYHSGFLISGSYVMTSASNNIVDYLIRSAKPPNPLEIKFTIKAGTLTDKSPKQVRTATHEDIKVHPSVWQTLDEYKQCPFKKTASCYDHVNRLDVMLIKVNKPFNVRKDVNFIAIMGEAVPFGGVLERGVLAGYGPTVNGSDGQVLRSDNGTIAEESFCRTKEPGVPVKWHDKICIKEYRTSACAGDVGGLIMHRSLVGLVAVGVVTGQNLPCGNGGLTEGVSTGAIADWVKSATGSDRSVTYRAWKEVKDAPANCPPCHASASPRRIPGAFRSDEETTAKAETTKSGSGGSQTRFHFLFCLVATIVYLVGC